MEIFNAKLHNILQELNFWVAKLFNVIVKSRIPAKNKFSRLILDVKITLKSLIINSSKVFLFLPQDDLLY
jgi:hypothetical protein